LRQLDFSGKILFLDSYFNIRIDTLTTQIRDHKVLRECHPENAYNSAILLYNNSITAIGRITSYFGSENLKAQKLCNSLANELFQSSITFFNYFRETDQEISEDALKLNEMAQSICASTIQKQEIGESAKRLETFIAERPVRAKLKLVRAELDAINNCLSNSRTMQRTLENVRYLLDSCKVYLDTLKRKLGAIDPLYMQTSNAVVYTAQNMLVENVNVVLEKVNTNHVRSIESKLPTSVERTIINALDTNYKIGTFDKSGETLTYYQNNLKGIQSIARQFGISILSPKNKLEEELVATEWKIRELRSEEFLVHEIKAKESENVKIKQKIFLEDELIQARSRLVDIKRWQLFRFRKAREEQIRTQEAEINNLVTQSHFLKESALNKCKLELEAVKHRAKSLKEAEISKQQFKINDIKLKIKKAEY
jgi:hypothetical protein